jgi:putative membrane protein
VIEMMWNWNMGMWSAGLSMLLWTILFVAVIAVAVVLVVRAVRTPPADRGRRDAVIRLPEDELRMRFARGEMDSEEFRRRMQDLRDA